MIIQQEMKRRLLISLLGIIVLIPLGLCSRQISWLPKETGDALWAMMVFCFWRIIPPKEEVTFFDLQKMPTLPLPIFAIYLC